MNAHSLSTIYTDWHMVDQTDTDTGGIPDRIEQFYGMDVFSLEDESGDLDMDGITNLQAYLLGMDLMANYNPSYDGDGDFMTNVWESAHGFDPNNQADGVGDPDGDGLFNYEEAAANTDPHLADTDGNGTDDWLQTRETEYPAGIAKGDASTDWDGDGSSNFDEVYVNHTDPRDAGGGGGGDGGDGGDGGGTPPPATGCGCPQSQGRCVCPAGNDPNTCACEPPPLPPCPCEHSLCNCGQPGVYVNMRCSPPPPPGTGGIYDPECQRTSNSPDCDCVGEIIDCECGKENCTCGPAVVDPALAEIDVNDTPEPDDDFVRKELKIGTKAWRQWIPCTVKVPDASGAQITSIGVTAESGTMKFSDAQAKPGDTTEGTANVNVTLDAQGQGTFWITGITQSANKGDAKLQIRKNGAAGEVLKTWPMTVFWFSGDTRAANDPDSPSATNCTRYLHSTGEYAYGLPEDGGIRLKAEAKVEPPNLDTSKPQIAEWSWSIVQNVSSTRKWHVTRTENDQTKKKVGTVNVPKSLDVFNTASFLFDPLATDSFDATGAALNIADAPTTPAKQVDLDEVKNKLDQAGKRYDWSKSIMGDAFTLWGGLVKFDANNKPTDFVPVFENTWSITADSSQANQKATPSAAKGTKPTVVPILQPPSGISQVDDDDFQWADEQ